MKRVRNKKGISIIEMLVSTLIIGLISILAVTAYINASKSTGEINSASYAQSVSTMLMNKINEVVSKSCDTLWISSDNSMLGIELPGNQPCVVTLGNENVSSSNVRFDSYSNYLQFYYLDTDDGNSYSLWSYPKKSYMDFVITNIQFTPIEKDHGNMIKVKLIIENELSGYSYSNTKFISIPNVKEIEIKDSTQNTFITQFENK